MKYEHSEPVILASYIVALTLILTAGLLLVAIVDYGSIEYSLYLSMSLLSGVLLVRSRNTRVSGIELVSLLLYIVFIVTERQVNGNLFFTVIIGASLLIIPLFNSIREKNVEALFSILLMGLLMVGNHNIYWFESLILMSTLVTLAGSKKVHSILMFVAVAPLVILSSNNPLIMYLITISFILFSINSTETRRKCPFRREVTLVIGGFAIQAGGILIGLILNDLNQIFSYWVLGYIISAVGLTSPPFYSIDLEDREGGL